MVRAYYGDTDAGGVVYHTRYIEFCERARYEFFAEVVKMDLLDLVAQGIVFAVVRVEIDYRRPGKLGDRLRVESVPIELKRASMRVAHRIVREVDGVLLSDLIVDLVCLDRNFKPQAIPAEIVKRLQPLLRPPA